MDRTTHIYIDETEYTGGISSGTMSLSEILCDGELTLGVLNSNKFEVTLFDFNEDIVGKSFNVIVTDGDDSYPIFTGYVDSSEKDRTNFYREIIAYDTGYFHRDDDVSSWWENFWASHSNGATLKELRGSLVTYIGITQIDDTLINDSITFTKFDSFTSLKFSDALKMICELENVIPHIGRDGVLRYKYPYVADETMLLYSTASLIHGDYTLIYMPESSTTSKGIVTNYEADNSDFEDFSVSTIDGVQYFDSNNNLAQQYPTNGTPTSAIGISDNALLMSLDSADVTKVLRNIYDIYQSYTMNYTPAEIKLIISDFGIQPGMFVKTEQGIHWVMENEYSGVQLVEQTITCSGDETLSSTTKGISNTTYLGKRFSSIEQNIDGITEKVGLASSSIETLAQGQQEIKDAMTGLVDSQTVQSMIDLAINQIKLEVNQKTNFVNSTAGTTQSYKSPYAPVYEYTGKYNNADYVYTYDYDDIGYNQSSDLRYDLPVYDVNDTEETTEVTFWRYDEANTASGSTSSDVPHTGNKLYVKTDGTSKLGYTTAFADYVGKVLYCEANGYYYQFQNNPTYGYCWHRLTEEEYIAVSSANAAVIVNASNVNISATTNDETSKIYVDRDEITFTVGTDSGSVTITVGSADLSGIGEEVTDKSITGLLLWLYNKVKDL